MAYQFPPRGFASLANNPQFPPHFGRPPHPSPAQSFQTPPPPLGGYCIGLERPPFHVGAPGSFPHGSSNTRGVRPGNRDARAWPGDSIAGPGPPLGQLPPRPGVPPSQRPMLQGPRCGWFPHRPPTFGGDVKHCEPWTELTQAGRQVMQGPCTPDNGQHSHINNHATTSLRKGGPSTKKKRNRRPSKNRHGAEAPSSENQNSNCTNSEGTPQQSSSHLEHYCDVCDRGFKSAALLDEHLTQHTKCKHPGCKFEAHFKIVKNHTKLQHGPGSKRVPWLDSPGEITKWREERKRNYPSVENIARKAAAKKSNEEKGAVLQNKYFGKMRQPKRWRQRHRGVMGDDGIAAKRARVDTARTNGDMKVEDANSGSHGKGDASSSPPHHQAEVTSNGNLGSLSALVAAYDESSEEEEGEIVEDSLSAEECGNQDKQILRHEANGQGSLDKPQDQSSPSDGRSRGRLSGWRGQGTDRRKPKQRTRRNKKGREGRLERERQARLRRRPNLLEMLLAPEIRRERNIILQCVRHIVRNDFFGVNQARKSEGRAAEQESERRPPSGVEEAPSQEAGMEVAKTNGHHSETDVRTEDKKAQRAKEEPLDNATTCQSPETDVGSHGENMGGKHWQLHERQEVEDADATGARLSSKEEGSNEEMDVTRATEVCNSTYEHDGHKSVEDSCNVDGNMDGVNESGSCTKESGEPTSLETGPKVETLNTNQLNDGFRKREWPEMTVTTARVSADECGLPESTN